MVQCPLSIQPHALKIALPPFAPGCCAFARVPVNEPRGSTPHRNKTPLVSPLLLSVVNTCADQPPHAPPIPPSLHVKDRKNGPKKLQVNITHIEGGMHRTARRLRTRRVHALDEAINHLLSGAIGDVSVKAGVPRWIQQRTAWSRLSDVCLGLLPPCAAYKDCQQKLCGYRLHHWSTSHRVRTAHRLCGGHPQQHSISVMTTGRHQMRRRHGTCSSGLTASSFGVLCLSSVWESRTEDCF